MAVSLRNEIRTVQKLALTQTMRQSLELLQMPALELAQYISHELEENPVLEELQAPTLLVGEPVLSAPGPDAARDVARDDNNWEPGAGGAGGDDDAHQPLLELTPSREESLSEHLLGQIFWYDLDERQQKLLEIIITGLDSRGYYDGDRAALAADFGFDEREVRDLFVLLQMFDPVGCGASSPAESLLAQARYFHPDDRLLARLIGQFFEELTALDYVTIERKLDITREQLKELCAKVQLLDPYPGLRFAHSGGEYVYPDLEVRYHEGEIELLYRDEWLPRVGINSWYQRMLAKKTIDKKLQEYIKDRVSAAQNLLRHIAERKMTIEKVVRAIMTRQVDFLRYGPGNLQPLVYQEIAQETGLHESTISRTVNGKYVATEWGVFELKSFFSARLKGESDDDHSADEVQKLVRDMVAMENPDHPLSDDEIAERLQKNGIMVARRTIAKYRTILGIPASNRRKRIHQFKAESTP